MREVQDNDVYIEGVWVTADNFNLNDCVMLGWYDKKLYRKPCDLLLPFYCMRDPFYLPISPFLSSITEIVLIAVGGLFLIIIFLLCCCWCCKSRRREKEHLQRCNSLRSSMRSLHSRTTLDDLEKGGEGKAVVPIRPRQGGLTIANQGAVSREGTEGTGGSSSGDKVRPASLSSFSSMSTKPSVASEPMDRKGSVASSSLEFYVANGHLSDGRSDESINKKGHHQPRVIKLSTEDFIRPSGVTNTRPYHSSDEVDAGQLDAGGVEVEKRYPSTEYLNDDEGSVGKLKIRYGGADGNESESSAGDSDAFGESETDPPTGAGVYQDAHPAYSGQVALPPGGRPSMEYLDIFPSDVNIAQLPKQGERVRRAEIMPSPIPDGLKNPGSRESMQQMELFLDEPPPYTPIQPRQGEARIATLERPKRNLESKPVATPILPPAGRQYQPPRGVRAAPYTPPPTPPTNPPPTPSRPPPTPSRPPPTPSKPPPTAKVPPPSPPSSKPPPSPPPTMKFTTPDRKSWGRAPSMEHMELFESASDLQQPDDSPPGAYTSILKPDDSSLTPPPYSHHRVKPPSMEDLDLFPSREVIGPTSDEMGSAAPPSPIEPPHYPASGGVRPPSMQNLELFPSQEDLSTPTHSHPLHSRLTPSMENMDRFRSDDNLMPPLSPPRGVHSPLRPSLPPPVQPGGRGGVVGNPYEHLAYPRLPRNPYMRAERMKYVDDSESSSLVDPYWSTDVHRADTLPIGFNQQQQSGGGGGDDAKETIM